MNTNTSQVIASTVSAGVFAGFIGLAVTGNILTGAAIGVSYLTVAVLIAMVASDYRSGPKAYFATPVVTNHFQRSVPASVAPRASSAKGRMAA
jgi:hypothetical protein